MSHWVYRLLKATFISWWGDRCLSMGAAIAFYTLFSLAPVLLIVVAIGGLVFGADAARTALIDQVGSLVGQEGAKEVRAIMASASGLGSGIIGTAIGIGTFLMSATAAFAELQTDLNVVWRVKASRASGFWQFLQSRFVSLALIAAFAFLLLVSLTFDALITAATQYVALEGWAYIIAFINLILSVVMATCLFAFIFKVLPDVRLPWRDVAPGAILTAVLFVIGKYAIGFYLGASNIASSYGAAASMITLLLWVYYSAQILLFGAEFTCAYVRDRDQTRNVEKTAKKRVKAAARKPMGRSRQTV